MHIATDIVKLVLTTSSIATAAAAGLDGSRLSSEATYPSSQDICNGICSIASAPCINPEDLSIWYDLLIQVHTLALINLSAAAGSVKLNARIHAVQSTIA